MEMKNPLLHGLSYAKWQTRSWKRWRGCSMNVFPQRVVEVHIVNMKTITVKNLVMKILVLVMVLAASVKVVVVGVLVLIISVEDDVDMIAIFYSVITCKPTTACCKYSSPNCCFGFYFVYT
ncbi:hypothetical protein E2562_024931 [Oryza meyeriana var. granulata]|uniref:Transmembrane protein n=1 Tax=Oryza meyeriana var. granulata TaxID=110450 RepID=A0A6G1DN21_9ORYZ|nr:hypothetical protein E2562_024931 [Oryza meyeriana var. granulata]